MIQVHGDYTSQQLRKTAKSFPPANGVLDSAVCRQSGDGAEGEFITREKRLTKDFEECPNCAEGHNRWIYQCDNCGFTGFYDGVYENGCYVVTLMKEPAWNVSEKSGFGLVG